MCKMIRVTKEEFFKVISPLDVTLSCHPAETLLKLRSSKELIGRTAGYKTDTDEAFYELSERWLSRLKDFSKTDSKTGLGLNQR